MRKKVIKMINLVYDKEFFTAAEAIVMFFGAVTPRRLAGGVQSFGEI
jgi:hypothetical protein